MSEDSDMKNLSSVLNFVNMQRQNSASNDTQLLKLESVLRVTNIPIVESGWRYAGNMYSKIKNANSLTQWTIGTAEATVNMAVDATLPTAMSFLNTPIQILDKIVCKSLDIVKQRVPSIYLPPQVMVWQTKEYMNDHLVKPVLKRADSVIEVGNAVLASKYTAYAADTLDSALNVADKYVDKYLPDAADQAKDGLKRENDAPLIPVKKETIHHPLEVRPKSPEKEDEERAKSPPADGPTGKAVSTYYHVDRFSKKLKRRLTKRTIAEAKALKHRSAESIHVLIYVAELVATDPKLALTKLRDLWNHLSQDEPENQARPATLEQLIVMLTRESARRLVHFLNFTKSTVVKLPSTISVGVHLTTARFTKILDNMIKTVRFVEGDSKVIDPKARTRRINLVVQQLNAFSNVILERLALALAGQPEPRKQVKTKHRNSHHHLGHVSAVRGSHRVGGQHRHSNAILNNGAQT